jgi:hypothetical protein
MRSDAPVLASHPNGGMGFELQGGAVAFPPPFGLSLSKAFPCLLAEEFKAKEGFDKPSPNGWLACADNPSIHSLDIVFTRPTSGTE